jgi:hypothetical protein
MGHAIGGAAKADHPLSNIRIPLYQQWCSGFGGEGCALIALLLFRFMSMKMEDAYYHVRASQSYI